MPKSDFDITNRLAATNWNSDEFLNVRTVFGLGHRLAYYIYMPPLPVHCTLNPSVYHICITLLLGSQPCLRQCHYLSYDLLARSPASEHAVNCPT
jgi:hypothetical protein